MECSLRNSVLVFFLFHFGNCKNDFEVCDKNPYQGKICAPYDCSDSKNQTLGFGSKAFRCEIGNATEEAEAIFPSWFLKGEHILNFFPREEDQKRKFCIIPRGSDGENLGGKFKSQDESLSNPTFDICTPRKIKLNMAVRYFQMASAFLSPFFIFLPIVIFGMTQEIQNVHSWMHFTNGCCVFALYVSWGLRYIFFRDAAVGSTRCAYFGGIQHYLHLSVFSWLLVASYDLLKLSQAHPSAKALDTRRQVFLYIQLSAFAWGIPLIYMGITSFIARIFLRVGMDPEGELAVHILPEYGRYRCFLGFKAYYLHLVLPTTLLFILASTYILRTLKILRRKKNETREHAVQKVNVMRNLSCLRVMVLTTVCWGCDILRSFMIAYDRNGNLVLRVMLDTIVIYQTIPIFVMYSCRPHILNHLEFKYPMLETAVEKSRKLFGVKKKEVDPGLVTHLRVHQRNTSNPSPYPDEVETAT